MTLKKKTTDAYRKTSGTPSVLFKQVSAIFLQVSVVSKTTVFVVFMKVSVV